MSQETAEPNQGKKRARADYEYVMSMHYNTRITMS